MTNQELRLAERQELESLHKPCEIYHLERIASILDRPGSYGIRLEYLDIEMTAEEQVAFFQSTTEALRRQQGLIERLAATVDKANEPAKPEVVDVNLLDPISASSVLARTNLHKCSHCGYGFYVRDKLDGKLSGWFRRAATCPKCGSTEQIFVL